MGVGKWKTEKKEEKKLKGANNSTDAFQHHLCSVFYLDVLPKCVYSHDKKTFEACRAYVTKSILCIQKK